MFDGHQEGTLSLQNQLLLSSTQFDLELSYLSRLWCETHCWLTRGIVFGLVSRGERGGVEGSWIGTLTGLEKGVTGA